MRHGKKFKHLSRKSAHRKAMLSNMATSLIMHKRISTTVTKAKELRKYIEPLITKSKTDSTHSRRIVFSYLNQKEAITELFSTVADKVAERPGGYTRIIKTGTRLGDNAETCIIELVDFNEIYVKETKRKSTRRRSRGGSKTVTAATEVVDTATEETKAEDVVDEVVDKKPVEEVKEEKAEEEVVSEKEVKKEIKEETPKEDKEELVEDAKEEDVKEEKEEEAKEEESKEEGKDDKKEDK